MLKSKRFNTAATIILTVLVIITLLPLALIVISSFTKESALIRNGYSFWPQEWSLDAYYYMIKQGAVILRSYGISVFVTVVGTAASVILTTMLAYPMSRKSFKYHNALSFFVFFTMLFNGGIVPSYIMWTKIFHIKDTIFALLIPNYLVTAFNVILVKNYYANNIPDSLIEAAEIDGATEMTIFRKIMLPLAVPTVATISLFTGLCYFKQYMVIVNRSAPFLVMVSQISGISQVHPMASDLSICPLHSLLCLQEKNNRPDAVWTCKHTNRIVIEPSPRRLYHLVFGHPLHS